MRELDPNDIVRVARTAIAHGLELATPVVLKIVAELQASANGQPLRPARESQWTVLVPASTSPHHRNICFQRGRCGLLAVVEMSSKPDPVLDRIIEKEFGHAPHRDPATATPSSIAVWSYDTSRTETMQQSLRGAEEDKWGSNRLFRISRATQCYDGQWLDPRDDISGEGLEQWPLFFDALRDTADQLSLAPFIEAQALELDRRQYKPLEVSEVYDRAPRLGMAIAKAEHYLPGPLLANTLSQLWNGLAAMQLEQNLSRLEALANHLIDDGHLDRPTSFKHDDVDNRAWATRTPHGFRMVFEDQTTQTALALHEGPALTKRVDVFSERDPSGRPLGSFELAAGVATKVLAPLPMSIRAIRDWNAWLPNLECAELEFEEEKQRNTELGGPGL